MVLLQLSTGNVLVRLVLAATGTITPDSHGASQGPERRLKGGRLLGPLERLFILGLGLAGNLTAAAIVVAAKGLLRWPELSSPAEQARGPPPDRVLPGRLVRELAGRPLRPGAAVLTAAARS